MEKPELDKREIILVKKGFFYYIFQAITFPIKLVLLLLKKIFGYTGTYMGWVKEYMKDSNKSKSLNKMLSKKLNDEEIV